MVMRRCNKILEDYRLAMADGGSRIVDSKMALKARLQLLLSEDIRYDSNCEEKVRLLYLSVLVNEKNMCAADVVKELSSLVETGESITRPAKDEPVFRVGDEALFGVSDELISDYEERYAIRGYDTELVRLLKQAHLRDPRSSCLFELVRGVWIEDAKYRGVWSPDPFPGVSLEEHPNAHADDIVLNNVASQYCREESVDVKQAWFDYKERWLRREIEPDVQWCAWNDTLEMIRGIKRGAYVSGGNLN